LNGFRWGQGRGLNRDEERYFSEDGPDEDDQPTPLISTPSLASSKASGSGLLKRKRSTGNSRAAGGSPQMTLPRTPPIGNLVGYGGDDDEMTTMTTTTGTKGTFSAGHPTFRRGGLVDPQKKGAMGADCLQRLGYRIGGLAHSHKHSSHYHHRMTMRTKTIPFWNLWSQVLV